jgi:hypothetical protein
VHTARCRTTARVVAAFALSKNVVAVNVLRGKSDRRRREEKKPEMIT